MVSHSSVFFRIVIIFYHSIASDSVQRTYDNESIKELVVKKFIWTLLLTLTTSLISTFAQGMQGVPSGWQLRCAQAIPEAHFTNAPHVTSFSSQCVWTNRAEALGSQLQFSIQQSNETGAKELPIALPTPEQPHIHELARGLDYDWQACFEFVRNEIHFAPYQGLLRGPERTLLEGVGSDADQAFLLLALLRASGYADSTVVYEPLVLEDSMQITHGFYLPLYNYYGSYPENAADWLNVPLEGSVYDILEKVAQKLDVAGRPFTYFTVGSVPCIGTDHFWVQLTMDGITYSLDPSLKTVEQSVGCDRLAEMEYNRTELIESAGGIVDENGVQELSIAGLSNQLNGLVATLRSAWTNENAAVSDYLGTESIVPFSGEPYFPGYIISGAPINFLEQDTETQASHRARVTLTHDALEQSFYLDELGTRCLWISYTNTTPSAQPCAVLYLDDTPIAVEPVTPTHTSATLLIRLDYPPGGSLAEYACQRGLSNVYAIPIGFGTDSKHGMRSWTTKALARVHATNDSPEDTRVIARTLHVIGQQWLSQTALATQLSNRLFGEDIQSFYEIGVVGQDVAPYVDFKNSFAYTTLQTTNLHGSMLFFSALEHAVLDQLNGTNSPAVSTIKLLELAHSTGEPIYCVDATNYATLAPLLTGYTAEQRTVFETVVASGRILLLPQNGTQTLRDWSGSGYVIHGLTSANTASTSMIILGQTHNTPLNGGFCTVPKIADDVTYLTKTQPTTTDANGGVPQTLQADPIAMPAGAYLDSQTDLLLNSKTPLAWTRHYDSRGQHEAGDLGRGWSHAFEAEVLECTNPDAVFGLQGSLTATLPTVVAMTVVKDLLNESANSAFTLGERARRWMVAALTVQWWTEHLTDSAVAVRLGSQSLTFQKQFDGSFAPYPGVTATLTKAHDCYTLTERLGDTYTFNENNRLASITDSSGNTTTLVYDSDPKLVAITNSFGVSLTFAWDGKCIVSITDHTGRHVRYAYDANQCLTNILDAASQSWSIAYDPTTFALLSQTDPENRITIQNSYNSLGQVTNQLTTTGHPWAFGYVTSAAAWDEDPRGHRLTQYFTPEGRPISRIDRDGTPTDYGYDGHGHLIWEMDALGRIDYTAYDGHDNQIGLNEGTDELYRITDFVYDDAHRLMATTNALGEVSHFTYDDAHRLLTQSLPNGTIITNNWSSNSLLITQQILAPDGTPHRQTAFTYNSLGLPLSQTITGIGLPPTGIQETYTYSSSGQLLTFTDANYHTTTFTYDAANRLLSTTDPLNHTTTFTYSPSGFLATTQNPLGHTTTRQWTPSGQLTSIHYPDGGIRTNTYDTLDVLATTTDPRGTTTTFVHDPIGRLLSYATPISTNQFTYNAIGLPLTATDATDITTTFGYDSLYRPIITQNALGFQWHAQYDLLDRLTATHPPLGKIHRTHYDPLGQPIATQKPSGATDRFGYDTLGNWTIHTNAEGHVFTMVYDALGRRTSSIDAIGHRLFTATYDGTGNLTNRIDGNGTSTTFTYDPCDRLTTRTTGTGTDTFTYDPLDNLLSAQNETVTESFTYDPCNRLTTAATTLNNHTASNAWHYDHGGLITNLVYAPSKHLTQTYDAEGRLIRVTDWLNHTWTFTYDEAGRPTGGTAPDGIPHTFAYDATGQLVHWQVGELAGRTIAYDPAGRRIRDTITTGTMPASHTSRRSENTFDAANRLISARIIYNITNAPVYEIYQYDGNGALTDILTDTTNTFTATYTSLGQLATLNSDTFTYDAIGNRIHFAGHHWIPNHADPLKRPLLECAPNGTILRYYIWSPTRLLGFIDATTDILTIAHSDDFGSIIALTTLTKEILYTAHYGPHGEDWGHTGTNPTPYTWLGGFGIQAIPTISTLGSLYLTRHRLYSATLHRFLSSDPLGLAGGLNLYTYAHNTPLAFIDPSGLCADPIQYSFWDNFKTGFTRGDFAERDIGWVGIFGQTTAGLIPIYGQASDIRDTLANIKNVYRNPSERSAWVGLGFAGLAWIPGGGDFVKGISKGGKKASSELLQSSLSRLDDVPKTTAKAIQTGGLQFSDDVSALIELSKKGKKTEISPQDAQTLLDWAKEYHLPARGPERHLNRSYTKEHIHIGPVNHITIDLKKGY